MMFVDFPRKSPAPTSKFSGVPPSQCCKERTKVLKTNGNHCASHDVNPKVCLMPHVVRYFYAIYLSIYLSIYLNININILYIYIHTHHQHCYPFTNIGGIFFFSASNGPGVCGLLTREELEHLARAATEGYFIVIWECCQEQNWLVVSTPLKHISQLG